MTRILIVEDEPDVASVLADDLRVEGYQAEIAADGPTALRMATDQTWDLIVLDLMLPKKDGFEVCRALRKANNETPVIMLTARVLETDKIRGLELGADDYITKPFSPAELRARIQAVLRRYRKGSANGVHRFADFEVDFGRGELRRGTETLEATPLEFKLLSAFIRSRGRVLSRSQL